MLSYPELPNFDLDVIVHSFIGSLTLSTFHDDLEAAINYLMTDDHLIDHPEWSSPEEEVAIRHHVRTVMMGGALGMRDHLRELKMLGPNSKYTYKRSVNSYVHLFKQSACYWVI